MKLFSVQFIKDFKANFSNFNAYIILLVYYILSVFSAIYLGDYFLRETDVMNAFFVMQPVILIFVIPAITMRSWAEEIKSGTIELLLTQPIGYFSLVLAKFLAAYSFFILLLVSSLFLCVFSNLFSIMDVGMVIWGYIGLLCMGAFFTAIGVAISIFSKNNILSYITTIFVLFTITQMTFTNIGNLSLSALNFEDNFIAFLSGVISIGNILYFIVGTGIFIWINLVGVYFRKTHNIKERLYLGIFLGILTLIFISIQIGSYHCFDKQFDVTDEKKFTLNDETEKILKNINKRIDITLYLAQNAREEANSSYSVFAEFAEKTLKQFERVSNGAIRGNVVLVQPFGELERKLIKDGVTFEEDKLGYKKFMAIEFMDNEGNVKLIKSFDSLRQNLLESDLVRVIKSFGNEKKKIAILANNEDLEKMHILDSIMKEFYDVTVINDIPVFILPTFDAVVIFRTGDVSSENLLALEQYVLRGGNLIVLAEPEILSLKSGKHIVKFLNSFGLTPMISEEPLTTNIENKKVFIGPSEVVKENIKNDIRSVLVNGVYEVLLKKQKDSAVYPILKFQGKNIGGVAEGKFISEYLNLALENSEVLPSSTKDGRVFFIYDTDLFMDYIFVSDETKSAYYYDVIPTNDNLLFILRLFDYATNANMESQIRYRHYTISAFSIGNSVLEQVKERYKLTVDKLEKKIAQTRAKKDSFYNTLSAKGFASVKNIGELSEFEQIIDETEDELNKMKLLIAKEYQTIIVGFTIFIILIMPLIYLALLFLILYVVKKAKQKKFKEAMNDIKTH